MPFADIPGARLYYETHGSGEPLLLHPGFGSTVEVYWANIPALAKRFRVIVFDPRGSGRTEAEPLASPTMADFARDAAALLDALGIESAHALGTSFGGMVVQHLALDHPQRVLRLVLACTTAGGPAHILPDAADLARFMASAEIADPVEALRNNYPVNYSDAYAARHDAELVGRALANAGLRSTPEGRAQQIAAIQGHDTTARLGALLHPTLVAHGDDDRVVPAANGRFLAEMLPGAALRLYAGARHIFFVERAAEFNTDVIAFLAGEPAWVK